jgi:hypothetical protein
MIHPTPPQRVALAASFFIIGSCLAKPGDGSEPIYVEGPETGSVDFLYSDGKLPPLVGTHNIQVLRATKDAPELAEDRGYTYNHHIGEIYYWNDTLYVTWGSAERSESLLPYRKLAASSSDGFSWSKPAEIYSLTARTPEDWDHAVESARVAGQLQSEYQQAVDSFAQRYPVFAAVFRKWRDHLDTQAYFDSQYPDWRSNHPKDSALPVTVAGAFGKGNNYYRRQDGQWVLLTKWAWNSLSADNGQTWTKPVIPPTVLTGHQKISGYRAADDRYFLFYDPVRSSSVRWPLVAVQGRDGITFGQMAVVHGEIPDMRYMGRWKDMGTQYNRVVMAEGPVRDAVWVAYSVNKEDIWISRVPLNTGTVVREPVRETFDGMPLGPLVPNWNIYRPKWAPIDIVATAGPGNHALQLQDADPYDYCRAVRVFPASRRLSCSFKVKPGQNNHGRLEIELASRRGVRPVRLLFDERGTLRARDHEGDLEVCAYKPDEWASIQLNVDLDKPTWQVVVNDSVRKEIQWANEPERRMEGPVQSVERISFRTGRFRRLGKCIQSDISNMTFYPDIAESYAGVPPGSDRPIAPAVYLIDDVFIGGKTAYDNNQQMGSGAK